MYYIHKAPACEALLEKYPHAASYIDGQVIVVGESFCNHVNYVVDLSGLELNVDITKDELDAKVDEFLAGDGGLEVVLSKAQGLYLYDKHKPVIEEEGV